MSLMRPELQVDTEQRQYFDPRLIGLRHIEQTARGAMARERITTTTRGTHHDADVCENRQQSVTCKEM